MDYETALRRTAHGLPEDAIGGFLTARAAMAALGALDTPLRAAHLIGQCAHESAGFLHRVEVLSYRSTTRLMAIFGRHFTSPEAARPYLGDPRALANHVYANRLGNGAAASDDGFRYRGRGWLQLTGRANYARMGRLLGLDLESWPALAAEPAAAWRIAAAYLATRKSGGRTALAWADEDNVARVTRIVNGGLHGLAQRRLLTARAAETLTARPRPTLARGDRGAEVLWLQTRLSGHGFPPGPLDGDFGPLTERALLRLQQAAGLTMTGQAGPAEWRALAGGPQPPALSRATAATRSVFE